MVLRLIKGIGFFPKLLQWSPKSEFLFLSHIGVTVDDLENGSWSSYPVYEDVKNVLKDREEYPKDYFIIQTAWHSDALSWADRVYDTHKKEEPDVFTRTAWHSDAIRGLRARGGDVFTGDLFCSVKWMLTFPNGLGGFPDVNSSWLIFNDKPLVKIPLNLLTRKDIYNRMFWDLTEEYVWDEKPLWDMKKDEKGNSSYVGMTEYEWSVLPKVFIKARPFKDSMNRNDLNDLLMARGPRPSWRRWRVLEKDLKRREKNSKHRKEVTKRWRVLENDLKEAEDEAFHDSNSDVGSWVIYSSDGSTSASSVTSGGEGSSKERKRQLIERFLKLQF